MDKETYREIKDFIKKVNAEFEPEQIILFGSRVKGEAWKRSDYDFIIVSKHFYGMHWLTRISRIVSLWEPLIDIDVLPYTPEEYEEKKIHS